MPGRRTTIPSDRRIRALHERYAPSAAAFELVYTHCEIVCALAERLLDGGHPGLDVDLVRAGCLLHDIGVYRLYDETGRLDQRDYVRHGVLGRDLLRDLGFPEVLARFCAHHTGVGLTAADVRGQALPLPVGDYLAETDEEQLVMYADKFHSKTMPPVFVTAATYAENVRRFGEDKVVRFAAMVARFGEPDLPGLAQRYGHPVV
ncbi:HD domain-containing protein [Catellatospora tritici]|uniref:HD domain-containing protein n=1 Tax=Catellatospora tritici TaxID=2851566 RepID=UPI001C2DAB02|nr:HD domain-containing protein [Catellatospora tritici]MBV1850663.1 HDIG domain-containing protein [Catellatospora tritici]